MKPIKTSLRNHSLLALIPLFVVACGQETSLPPELDTVTPDSAELARALGDYAFNDKTLYVEEMQKQLSESDADLERYSDSVSDSGGQLEAEIEGLRELSVELHGELAKANNATESSWMAVTGAFEKGLAEFRVSIESLRSRIDAGVSEPDEADSEPEVETDEEEGSTPEAEPEKSGQL
jgi:hypothetical protein